ncbi:MAG: NosD domain-containing protein [Thermoproteota archaeon]
MREKEIRVSKVEMKRCPIVMLLIAFEVIMLMLNVKGIEASYKGETIRIKIDGSIEPSNAPIKKDGNIYTLTDDVEIVSNDGIVVEKDNIIIDGNSRLLRKIGEGQGIYYCGIRLENRKYVKVRNVQIRNFGIGIYLQNSSNNEISKCNIEENRYYGIYLTRSSSNEIIENTINKDRAGLWLICYSNNNKVTKNRFIDCNLFVISNHNSVIDNTVNGKPLIYIEEESGKTISNVEVGQIILVGCSNIIVENLWISNTSVGIELWETKNSIIRGNIVENNWWGIYLGNSSNNKIIENDVRNNNDCGILLVFTSLNNEVTMNNINNNNYGIWLAESSNNKIHHNNFINNRKQVFIKQSINTWNDDIIGNYWSDYKGFDSDNDGVGDISYIIDDNKDKYPSMNPWFSVSISAPYGTITFRSTRRGDFWRYGTTTAEGWLSKSSTLTISISPTQIDYDNGTRIVFSGWYENGNLLSKESQYSVNVTKNFEITAAWDIQHLITVSSSYGIPTGAYWQKEGSIITISIPQTIVDYGNYTRRVFKGWFEEGSLVSSGQSISVKVDRPRKIVANWDTEYEVKALSEKGTPVGSGWYKFGEIAIISISLTRVEEFLVNHIFEGWKADGKLFQPHPTYSFIVDKPVTLVASWRTELNVINLTLVIGAFTIVFLTLTAVLSYKHYKEEKEKRRKEEMEKMTEYVDERIRKVKEFLRKLEEET